jgi:hypothetical protein
MIEKEGTMSENKNAKKIHRKYTKMPLFIVNKNKTTKDSLLLASKSSLIGKERERERSINKEEEEEKEEAYYLLPFLVRPIVHSHPPAAD